LLSLLQLTGYSLIFPVTLFNFFDVILESLSNILTFSSYSEVSSQNKQQQQQQKTSKRNLYNSDLN
jgi:hypothetical protein